MGWLDSLESPDPGSHLPHPPIYRHLRRVIGGARIHPPIRPSTHPLIRPMCPSAVVAQKNIHFFYIPDTRCMPIHPWPPAGDAIDASITPRLRGQCAPSARRSRLARARPRHPRRRRPSSSASVGECAKKTASSPGAGAGASGAGSVSRAGGARGGSRGQAPAPARAQACRRARRGRAGHSRTRPRA
jgi:hypothetical protein